MIYQIRSAQQRDIAVLYDFICKLEETTFDYGAFERIFNANIYYENYYYLVAEFGEVGIIGFISCHTQNLLHHCGNVAEIQELYVGENYRNQGIGELLLNNIKSILEEKNCMSLEVTAQNKRVKTHHFYERLGFKLTHKKFVYQF